MEKENSPKSINELKPQDFSETKPKDFGANIWTNGYYIRNDKNEPKITITFAVDMTSAINPIISMGFAIAGANENPWKFRGQTLSEARAIDAIKLKEKANTTDLTQLKKRLYPVKREEAIKVLEECHSERFIGMNKGIWNVPMEFLTDFEKELIEELIN